MFFEIAVLKNFTNFTWKHLCWSFSQESCRPSKLQLYEKETPTQVFSCKLDKIFMNALLQSISDGCFWQFQDSSLQLNLKIDPGFCKLFKNIFWQNSCGWLLLVFICEFWKVFLNTFFIEYCLGNCLFCVQVAEFQPADTVKKYLKIQA